MVEREREYYLFFFHGQLGKNRGEMWKGSNKKLNLKIKIEGEG